MSKIRNAYLICKDFLTSQSTSNTSLRWLAGTLGMTCVFMMLFGIRDEFLYSSEWADRNYFSIYPLKAIVGLPSYKTNWYIATQLTLDSIFPIFYGLFFFAAIDVLIPDRFKCFCALTLGMLILVDFFENITQVVYLGLFQHAAIELLANLATTAKFLLLGFIVVGLAIRCVANPFILIWQGKFHYTVIPCIDHLVRVRFPLIALVFFTIWAPIAARFPAIRTISANALLISSYEQIGLLSCVNTLAIVFSIAMLRAIWEHIEKNILLNKQYKTGPWKGWHYLLVFMLNLPTPFWVFHYSILEEAVPKDDPGWIYLCALSCICVGYLFAIVLIFIFGQVVGFAIGQKKGENNFFPTEILRRRARLRRLRNHGAWYFAIQMTFYVLILSFLFFVVFNLFEKQLTWLSVPSLLIMLVWLLATIATRIALWLDAARIPTTIPLLLVVIAVRFINFPEQLPVSTGPGEKSTTSTASSESKSSNEVPADQNANEPAKQTTNEASKTFDSARDEMRKNVWKSIQNRLSPTKLQPEGNHEEKSNGAAKEDKLNGKDKGKTLVVVTCPGGGIHAAAWAAIVLEKLDQRYVDFSDSICLMSSVSGGGVGTMFFADRRYPIDENAAGIKTGSWKRASMSSLEAIGAGLAFHDIPALFIPFWPGQDRGVRLESELGFRLHKNNDGPTLSDWGEKALNGKMPIIVFNAADAASGRRILFATLQVPPRNSLEGRIGRPWDYRELIDFPAHDFRIETAARASASFPYISPFASPEHPSDLGKGIAVCDGGFVDNEGIVTAIDWLDLVVDMALEEIKAQRPIPFQRVLLLRIQPSSDLEDKTPNIGQFSLLSQFRWLTGPVEALANMRTTSQVERGILESDLVTSDVDSSEWGAFRSNLNSSDLETKQRMRVEVENKSTKKKNKSTEVENKSTEVENKSTEEKKGQSSKADSNGTPKPSSKLPSQQDKDPTKQIAIPVLVCNVAFEHPEPLEPIPLNWKLSPNQEQWYEDAWKQFLAASSNQGKGNNSNSSGPLQLLDSLFVLRSHRNMILVSTTQTKSSLHVVFTEKVKITEQSPWQGRYGASIEVFRDGKLVKTFRGSTLPNFEPGTQKPADWKCAVVQSTCGFPNFLKPRFYTWKRTKREDGKSPCLSLAASVPTINLQINGAEETSLSQLLSSIVDECNANRYEESRFAKNILVHSGAGLSWENSAGCLTVDPNDAKDFFELINEGMNGTLEINRVIEDADTSTPRCY